MTTKELLENNIQYCRRKAWRPNICISTQTLNYFVNGVEEDVQVCERPGKDVIYDDYIPCTIKAQINENN